MHSHDPSLLVVHPLRSWAPLCNPTPRPPSLSRRSPPWISSAYISPLFFNALPLCSWDQLRLRHRGVPPNLLVCSPTPLSYAPLSVHASLLCSWDQLYTPTTRYDPPLCVSALRHQSLCVCILVGSALHSVWPHQNVLPSICLCTFYF